MGWVRDEHLESLLFVSFSCGSVPNVNAVSGGIRALAVSSLRLYFILGLSTDNDHLMSDYAHGNLGLTALCAIITSL